MSEPLPALETVLMVPLLEGLPIPLRLFIARAMVRVETFEEGSVIPARGPDGCIRILEATGLLRHHRRLPVPEGAELFAKDFDFDIADKMNAHARRRFGGALLPEPVLGDLIADGTVRVFTLLKEDLEDMRARAPGPKWRWDRLIQSLSIARALTSSPILASLDRPQRHALAAVMTWRPVAVGDERCPGAGPFAGIGVLGQGARGEVALEHRDGRRYVVPLGTGNLYGLAAWLNRNRGLEDVQMSERITRAGQVATLGLAPPMALLRALSPLARLIRKSRRELEQLLGAMAASPFFAGIDSATLWFLLISGRPFLWRVANHHPAMMDLSPGLVVVVEGELIKYAEWTGDPNTPHVMNSVASYRGGEVFGEGSMVHGRMLSERLTPRIPTRVLVLPAPELIESLLRTPAIAMIFGRNVARFHAATARRDSARARIAAVTKRAVDVSLFQVLSDSVNGPDPLAMARLLAESIQEQFQESVGIVRLAAGDGGRLRMSSQTGSIPEWRVTGGWTDVVRTVERIHASTHHLVQVLVVPEGDAPKGAQSEMRELVDRVVYLNHGAEVLWPPATSDTPFTYTAMFPADTRFEATAGCPLPPGTVRMHVEDGAIRPEQIARWARAVTDRRVGVALGGGGSWGYCHVAVVMALTQLGIPIDLVSGTSFGAVVGAYYAHDTLQGMEQLLHQQARVQMGSLLSFASGAGFERMLNGTFGNQRLENLECPFLPVATDLVTGSERTLFSGTLGRGVRTSGAYAPMMPGVKVPGGFLVDGGMSANVPARAVQHEGARLIISSDAVPPSSKRQPFKPSVDIGVLDTFFDMTSLSRRMSAYMAGQQVLMNTAGEMSAGVAPVRFESNRSVSFPALLLNGRKIVRNALTDPEFWSTLKLAEQHWDQIRAPRR